MGCSCAGTDGSQNGGEELLFPVSSSTTCRDAMFPHPRTKSCDLISQLPTSITIDSGYNTLTSLRYNLLPVVISQTYIISYQLNLNRIHAETLLSNQPNWINYSTSLDPNTLEVGSFHIFSFSCLIKTDSTFQTNIT